MKKEPTPVSYTARLQVHNDDGSYYTVQREVTATRALTFRNGPRYCLMLEFEQALDMMANGGREELGL